MLSKSRINPDILDVICSYLDFGHAIMVKHALYGKKLIEKDINRMLKYEYTRDEFCKYAPITEVFVNDYPDFIVWSAVSENTDVTENFLRTFQDKVHWRIVGKWKHLSTDFMLEFYDRLNFGGTIKFVPAQVIEHLKKQGYVLSNDGLRPTWYKPI